MRIYKVEKVDEILSKMTESLGFLMLAQLHKSLGEAWKKIPDSTLRELDLAISINTDGTLLIECPSSVALTYVRNRRKMIADHLKAEMKGHSIQQINITLSKR